MNPAQRESFYRCTRCQASSWHFLSKLQACAKCEQQVAPHREDIVDTTITARYTCCSAHWSHTFDMRRRCGCGAFMMPEIGANSPIGVAVSQCKDCAATIYEFNSSLNDVVLCRECTHYTPATFVCSPAKFMQWRVAMTDATVAAQLASGTYIRPARPAPRSTTARTTPVSPLANPFDLLTEAAV